MHKTHFVHIFDAVTDISSNCFVFKLPTIKLIKMLAHCANTSTEMLSPFVDNSVDNALLQTNPDFTASCFLNSYNHS